MGCRILESREDGAVLYCSTTMWAFGPIFESGEAAEAFLKWLGFDPRSLSNKDLESNYTRWLEEKSNDE